MLRIVRFAGTIWTIGSIRFKKMVFWALGSIRFEMGEFDQI